jgi:putative DNA primase/helicase
MSAETEMIDAITAAGLVSLTMVVADGRIHRFGRNKTCWYILFDGSLKAGAFGDWKSGVSQKFIESRDDITPEERQQIAKQMREAVVQREAIEKSKHAHASTTVTRIWGGAGESGFNHYLASKELQSLVSEYGMRQDFGPFNGYEPFNTNEVSLIVPATCIEGAIWSLQFIAGDGRKKFYPGGKLRGHFCPIGLHGEPEKILIAEGVATALTLQEDTGLPVIAAFNANNLVPVAESIRWKYTSVDILICGDDDHTTEGNPGRTKAIQAAARCGGDWVLPEFTGLPRGPKDTDFNDLRQLRRCAA